MTPDRTPPEPVKSEHKEIAAAARSDYGPVYKRILLPVDFSDHSKGTISYAMRIAVRDHSKLYLLHVFQVPDYIVMPYGHRSDNSAEVEAQVGAAERQANLHLEALNQELLERGIETEAILRVGYPFEEIVLTANHYDCDLIVIGSHGRSRIARLLLGSTAERVVAHARCPVLVVKGSQPASE